MKLKQPLLATLITLSLGAGVLGLASCAEPVPGPQGEKGEQGIQGVQGEKGEDGKTPVITIGENGNWFIDGVDTNVSALGEKGDKGDKGDQGEKGDKGDNGTGGFDGEDGEDGAGVQKVEFDENGLLVITLTDGTVLEGVKLPKESLRYQKIAGKDEYRVVGIGMVSDLDIVIPNAYNGLPVTEIGDYAFVDETYITSVTIPDSITAIGRGAFAACHNLTSVVIDNSVMSIGYYAFNDCPALTNVYYKGTELEWPTVMIDDGNLPLTSAICYYYSESQPTEENKYWHYDDNDEIAVWEVPPIVVTDTFEAEYTYFDSDETFCGWTGTANGKYSICYTNVDGTGIYYMGYVYATGTTITYKINASQAVDNVTLKVNVATVYKTNVTFGPTGEYAWKVTVNGETLDYTPFTYDGAFDMSKDDIGEFKTYTLSTTVSLKEGENTIEFITDNANGVYGTMQGFAPTIDYIQLITEEEVELSYEPIYENLE